MNKCLTCGAVYPAMQPDGTRYFHACAPLTDAEVSALLGLNADVTKLTPTELAQLRAAARARPNARNENVPTAAALAAAVAAAGVKYTGTGDDPANKIRDVAIVSAGAGVTVV